MLKRNPYNSFNSCSLRCIRRFIGFVFAYIILVTYFSFTKSPHELQNTTHPSLPLSFIAVGQGMELCCSVFTRSDCVRDLVRGCVRDCVRDLVRGCVRDLGRGCVRDLGRGCVRDFGRDCVRDLYFIRCLYIMYIFLKKVVWSMEVCGCKNANLCRVIIWETTTMPEWSKGEDLRSSGFNPRGFNPHW